MTSYFVYSSIPGAGRGWSLAVLAVSRSDADAYMRKHHKGARFLYDVKNGGTVKADCGAVTPAAQEVLRKKIETPEA